MKIPRQQYFPITSSKNSHSLFRHSKIIQAPISEKAPCQKPKKPIDRISRSGANERAGLTLGPGADIPAEEVRRAGGQEHRRDGPPA